jgi:hypothetical protein
MYHEKPVLMTQQPEQIVNKSGLVRDGGKSGAGRGKKCSSLQGTQNVSGAQTAPPPTIQWAPGPLFHGIKRPRREFDLSLLSNARLGMSGAVTPPPISFNGV